jgi:osmotically-inducible protein OsmY
MILSNQNSDIEPSKSHKRNSFHAAARLTTSARPGCGVARCLLSATGTPTLSPDNDPSPDFAVVRGLQFLGAGRLRRTAVTGRTFMARKFFATLGLAAGLTLMSAPLAALETLQTSAAKPTDDTIKNKIEYQLETSSLLKKYDIKVAVSGGAATLSGTVATDAQKAEAARVAKISGITKVDNNITVDKNVDQTLADRAKSGLRKTGEAITDAWITTKVKWFYTGDDALKGSDINVDTANKVVTLKGTVPTAAGKKHAVDVAKSTEGVTRVVDELVIKPAK